MESLQANVQRLKEYTAKLLVFPMGRVKKAKNAAELKNVRHTRLLLVVGMDAAVAGHVTE